MTLILIGAAGCGEFEAVDAEAPPTSDVDMEFAQAKSDSPEPSPAVSMLPLERKVMDSKRFGASNWMDACSSGFGTTVESGFIDYTVSPTGSDGAFAGHSGFANAFSDVKVMEHHAGPVRMTHQAVFKDPRFPINPFLECARPAGRMAL